MKIVFLFPLLFISQIVYSQQFSFNQLIEMTNDKKVFEIQMIKSLNQTVNMYTSVNYKYRDIAQPNMQALSLSFPTNDPKYEPIFKFGDGKIYKESEIINGQLDLDYSIRKKLRNDGQPINGKDIVGFEYVPSKITSIMQSETIQNSFAENYDSDKETASTWYHWDSVTHKQILSITKPYNPSFKKLTILFGRDSDFSNILKQIILVSKYIETKEDINRSFESNYKYGNYSIYSERGETGQGGTIKIVIVQK